jgi:phage repressor protein C with HTH and peptisase S24 domain
MFTTETFVDLSQVSDIIAKEVADRGGNQSEIARKLGISSQLLGQYIAGRHKPKADFYIKWKTVFGEDLLDLIERNVSHENNGHGESQEIIPHIERRRAQKNQATQPYMVPLVPVKAQAGYAMSYPDTQLFSESLEKYPMLPGIEHRGAEWRYFEVEGDSMIPTLFDKDYILVSSVLREDWQDIKPNKPYVVVIGEDVYVKFIYRIDKENWILASANKKVKHKKIAVSDVRELWVFRGRTTKNLDIPKIEIKV